MEDAGTDVTADSGSDSRGLIRKASSATDAKDNNLIYDHERFRKNKTRRHYDFYNRDHRVIIKRGVIVSDFDDYAPRVQAVFDA